MVTVAKLRAPDGKTIVWGSVHQPPGSAPGPTVPITVGQVPLAYLAYPCTVTYMVNGVNLDK